MRYYIPLNILSIAHRGYSAKYKDNSWPAFKNVRNKGFDMIELIFNYANLERLLFIMIYF